MKGVRKFEMGRLLLVSALTLGAIIMVFPFIWMVLTSFKTFAESVAIPIVWFPAEWNFKNYVQVLEKLDFIVYYKNTIIYTVAILFGQLFCALWRAMPLAGCSSALKTPFFSSFWQF